MKLSASLLIPGLGTEQSCGRIKTSALDRSVFATLMRVMAYNEDFNKYVHAALESHGLPIDPKMDWSKWLNTVYRRNLPTLSDEIRDEAIHEVLTHHLFEPESDILRKFDPSRLKESIQAKPLAEQVSSYLKMCFVWMVGDAIKYLKKVYPEQEIAVGLTNDEAPRGPGDPSTPSILNKIQHGVVDPEEEVLVHNVEIRKLRHAFDQWCDSRLRPGTATKIKHFFDLIVVFDGTTGELLKEFASKAGVSESYAKQLLYRELPKYLRQFSVSDEGKGFSLAKRIRVQLDKERVNAEKPEPAPSPEPAPTNS